jgi:cell wall-associated NlpC family hydrolase
MRLSLPTLTAALALALLAAPVHARDVPSPATSGLAVPASGVIGMQERYLSPEFWIARLQQPDAVIFDRVAIAARNARLMQLDDSLHDLSMLPATLERAQVAQWVEGLSRRPTRTLYGEDHKPIPAPALDAAVANAGLDAIPHSQPTRYGMAVRRAALRTFPTRLRVFTSDDNTDIDRFQESALFPGTPVAIVHASRDGEWLFVVSPRYAAWVERDAIAEGAKEAVLAYAAKAPYRVVTGAKVRTVFTPEEPRVSELQLDMGVRAPLADVPPDQPVNGQHPYTSWPLELPVRNADGSLAFVPALVQKNADTQADYLPLTRANLIRQAFRFLGERYGWGHDYNGRDCSGFVSEVYRSMGVLLPRNTSDQGVSAGLDHTLFGKQDDRARREAAVRALQVGDLVYIPGHVMMVIGRIGDVPYVIHDTNGGSYLGADGKLHPMQLNAVSVTPLTPMRFNARERYIDRMTSIVRIRPTANQEGTTP